MSSTDETPMEIGRILRDISIIVRENFNLNYREQQELTNSIYEFYFPNGLHYPECIHKLVDVSILPMKFTVPVFAWRNSTACISPFFLPALPILVHMFQLYSDLFTMKFYDAVDYLIRSDVAPYIYLFAYDGSSNFIKNLIRPRLLPGINLQGRNCKYLPP